MIRRPPRSTRTDTLFPDTTLCRSTDVELQQLAFDDRPVIGDVPAQRPRPSARPGFGRPGTLRVERDESGDLTQLDEARKFDRPAVIGIELPARRGVEQQPDLGRSEEHTSELQSLMRISYAVFCLTKKNTH